MSVTSLLVWGRKQKTPVPDMIVKDERDARGATLIHGVSRALCGIRTYPRQLTYASTSRNTEPKPFPAPSVIHLPARILPGSQRSRTLCEGDDRRYLHIIGLMYQIMGL